jgi:hypothetical protein
MTLNVLGAVVGIGHAAQGKDSSDGAQNAAVLG